MLFQSLKFRQGFLLFWNDSLKRVTLCHSPNYLGAKERAGLSDKHTGTLSDIVSEWNLPLLSSTERPSLQLLTSPLS